MHGWVADEGITQLLLALVITIGGSPDIGILKVLKVHNLPLKEKQEVQDRLVNNNNNSH